jgi:hypothetical protein
MGERKWQSQLDRVGETMGVWQQRQARRERAKQATDLLRLLPLPLPPPLALKMQEE